MSSSSRLPEWVIVQCEAKGVRPTQRGIAEKAGTYAPTVRRVFEGRGDTASNEAVAHALGMDLATFSARIGASNELGPWVPPIEAHHLGAQEREALGTIIRAMRQQGSDGDEQAEAAEITDAGGTPAYGQGDVTLAADDEKYDEGPP